MSENVARTEARRENASSESQKICEEGEGPMDTFGWDQMADWWDQKLGDDGDLWHRTLIDPPVLRLAGEVRGLSVLDLAVATDI